MPRHGYKRANDDQHDWLIELKDQEGTTERETKERETQRDEMKRGETK